MFAFVTLTALPAMAFTLGEKPGGGDEVGATPPDQGDGTAVAFDARSDGAEVLVVGFFAVAGPRALVGDTGLKILPQVAETLDGPMVPGQYAQATPGVAGEPVARVATIDGEAFAVRADGTGVALTDGSQVFQGDVLETGPGAAVGLIYIDGMTMGLDENTRMVVDQVFYDPTANQGKALFSLVEGAFLSLSGEIAKLGEDVVQIQTPTGVIGIRGTNLAASHIGITQVVLLPNPDGTVSALIFVNDGGFVILDEAFEGLRSTSFDLAPSQPTIFASLEAALTSLGISPKAAGTFDQTVSQALAQKAEALEQGVDIIDSQMGLAPNTLQVGPDMNTQGVLPSENRPPAEVSAPTMPASPGVDMRVITPPTDLKGVTPPTNQQGKSPPTTIGIPPTNKDLNQP